MAVTVNSEITFISNNFKGIQNSVKRIKLFEYLKSYVTANGFIFLQETRSCITDQIKWRVPDKSGKILSVKATIDDTVLVLINIYNANTEPEQLDPLSNLVSIIIDKVKYIQSKNIVLGGDFNVMFDISLASLGRNPCLKKRLIAKLIQIKGKFN